MNPSMSHDVSNSTAVSLPSTIPRQTIPSTGGLGRRSSAFWLASAILDTELV